MTKNKKSAPKVGAEGEKAFQDWMDNEEIGYLRIDQAPNSLSNLFIDSIKRPDFLILLPSIGFIATDVKHYKLNEDSTFTLNIPQELIKSASFEQHTRLYMWYVYKDNQCDDPVWYFISAQKALDKGKKRTNSNTNDDFLSIHVKHFHIIKKIDDIQKIFNPRIGYMGQFARYLEKGIAEIKI